MRRAAMKCPVCNYHELRDYAWVEDGGMYRSDDHYDCANCGAIPKEYVDAVAAQLAELREKYNDLIMQVATKYPNETRHDTAKRYIYNAEHQDNQPVAGSTTTGEQ